VIPQRHSSTIVRGSRPHELGRILALASTTLAATVVAIGLPASAQAQPLSHTKKHVAHVKIAKVVFAKKRSPYGTILTGAHGRTLYIHTTDGPNRATCTGSCAAIWPLATVSGSTKIGQTVKGLGFYKLKDGKKVLTIDKHPLYYFAADTSSSVQGEGIAHVWYVVNTEGRPVKAALGKVATVQHKKKTSSNSGYSY
jgi:predicted lipoprotein with Yx(FWY)xxD motif